MGVDTSYRPSTDHDAIVRTCTDPDGPGRHVRTRTDPDGPGRINPIIDTYDVRTRTDPDGPGRTGRTRTDRTDPDGPDDNRILYAFIASYLYFQ